MLLVSFVDSIAPWATLALATFTGVLAFATRTLGREAGRQTRANWRPVLTIEPPKVRYAFALLVLAVALPTALFVHVYKGVRPSTSTPAAHATRSSGSTARPWSQPAVRAT